MPVKRTENIVVDVWNADKFRAALVSALIALGYKQVAGSGNDLIFSIAAPLSKPPKDQAYLRVLVEQLSVTNIRTQVWQGDGVNQNTLLNSAPIMVEAVGNANIIGYGSGESFPIKFVAFDSAEVKLVCWMRSDNQQSIGNAGFIFPSMKSESWPDNSLFAFAATHVDFGALRCLPGNPYGPGWQDFSPYHEGFPNNVNFGGNRDILKRLIVSREGGIAGQTSPDIGILAAGGMGQLAEYESGGEVWVNIRNARSLAFRVA
ncbi:hypothetical protein ACE1CD_15535 [Aerosakkonema sp. BLCC-F183]|uniref:hypothetical protein n=1 Tax=Aerosakkonema sp. BLCC-F183 TaxID=3342834 RepID=UPI0035B6FEBC